MGGLNITLRVLRTFVFHDLRAFWFLVIREYIPHIIRINMFIYTRFYIYIYVYVPVLPAKNQQIRFGPVGE